MPSVPSVSGLSLAEAVNAVISAGLGIGGVTSTASDAPAGTVVATDPAAWTELDGGASVTLVVSDGPPPPPPTFDVPDVIGSTLEQARNTLAGAGFTVSASSDYSTDDDFGRVVSQSPAAGAIVSQLVEVAIVISRGSPPHAGGHVTSPVDPPTEQAQLLE